MWKCVSLKTCLFCNNILSFDFRFVQNKKDMGALLEWLTILILHEPAKHLEFRENTLYIIKNIKKVILNQKTMNKMKMNGLHHFINNLCAV